MTGVGKNWSCSEIGLLKACPKSLEDAEHAKSAKELYFMFDGLANARKLTRL